MAGITNTTAHEFTIGIALDGAGWHPSAWRDSDARPHELFTAGYWRDLAESAERAGLDYLTIDDSLGIQQSPGSRVPGSAEVPSRPDPGIVSGRLDAALLASWIAPRTERIGLIPTVTTTHTEPFHVATGLQTLDHVSQGRAGWQLRISAGAAEAAAFGRKPAPAVNPANLAAGTSDPALNSLLNEGAEAAEVARRLWDSWEDGAIIKDADSGRFLDRDRLHYAAFEGENFSVIGPSIVPRSPQGQLPITVLAHSTPIYRLAARAADVVFITPHPEPGEPGAYWVRSAQGIVDEIRAIAQEVDRDSLGLAPLRIVADLVVAFDGAGELASERVARLDGLGTEFFSDAHLAAGSAEQIAELITEWREAGIDGVRLRPLSNAHDVSAIGEQLIPALRARGLATRSLGTGISLRETFGLPRAANRYATRTTHATPAEKEYAA